ncbi:MAG: TrkA family potassium uptake protein, partial [Candidatus Glassbacteria bacterium]|nr:TrkA family potassium uptake protein [Candidatus Glassbacteria bacterium]
ALHFQVPRCMALVNDPENEEIFRRLGVTAFSTTGILASLIDHQSSWEEITTLLPLGGGKVNILELKLEKDAPVCGQTLQQITLPPNSLIAVVMRDGETIVPRGGTVLQDGDRIILITLPQTLGESLEIITGGKR